VSYDTASTYRALVWRAGVNVQIISLGRGLFALEGDAAGCVFFAVTVTECRQLLAGRA
jgi:hypothetical protein